MNAAQFRDLIVAPALRSVELWSQSAENLLMGTAAQESRFQYVKQLGGGPALGLFQMEPNTYHDIWENYLSFRPELVDATLRAIRTNDKPAADRMIWDARYAAIMCRIHYRRIQKPLPHEDDVWALAGYYKSFYNTVKGKATEQEFVNNYRLTQ